MDKAVITYILTAVCWAAGMVLGIILKRRKNDNARIGGQMILTIFVSLAMAILGMFAAGALSLAYIERANLYSLLVLIFFGALLFMLLGFIWTDGVSKKLIAIFVCVAVLCTATFGVVRIYDANFAPQKQQVYDSGTQDEDPLSIDVSSTQEN